MKIQISPTKQIEDALVIWYEELPEVDIVIDPRYPHGLKFKQGSVGIIYAFNILGITEPKKILPTLEQWYKILAPNGQLYIIEQDFDYINRAFLGGDLKLSEFNQDFRKSTYLNQETIVELLDKVGFPSKDQRKWGGEGLKFKVNHFEVVISGTKPLK